MASPVSSVRRSATSKGGTLATADEWFKSVVIPKRTAAAGFSGNRLWKTPAALVLGNTEDPNGLCGDASAFVVEEFFRTFGRYDTADGFHVGVILWEGFALNHMAAVMLKAKGTSKDGYRYDTRIRTIEHVQPVYRRVCRVGDDLPQYSTAALFGLHVYDLYYKKLQTVQQWWQDMDRMGGTVTIGLLFDFAE